jgi:hypothetical protein
MPERDCMVFIPSGVNPTAHYQSSIRAESTLAAAAKFLALHEDRIRRRQLHRPDVVPEDGAIRVVVAGTGGVVGTAFDPAAPHHKSYYYRIARVREWIRETGRGAPPKEGVDGQGPRPVR